MRAVRLVAALAALAGLSGCAGDRAEPAAPVALTVVGAGFDGSDCNGITGADITRATESGAFAAAVINDVGCFWQENPVIGTFGAGMGISTWWYRGSELDVERALEQRAGRTITDLSVDGNEGFKAYDANACSIYVAKGDDVITWSIQTMNPSTLPPLCAITDQLAELSQDRVN